MPLWDSAEKQASPFWNVYPGVTLIYGLRGKTEWGVRLLG